MFLIQNNCFFANPKLNTTNKNKALSIKTNNIKLADSFEYSNLDLKPLSPKPISFGSDKLRFRSDKDKKYIQTLANKLKTNSKNLDSVMGVDELKTLLSSSALTPENFLPGEKDQNLLSGKFKINLHLHTVNSDGKMTPQKVLDQAADYSAKYRKNKPVYVAISDHNTINGSAEALKIISQNPKKYKNIKFIPSVEIAGAYKVSSDNSVSKFELLAYGINPFDEKLENFLSKKKTSAPSIGEIFQKLQNSNTFLSLAHPARTSIKTVDEYKNFLNKLNANGLKGIEYYYSYDETKQKANESYKLLAENFANSLGLIKTGGRDCHENNIFHRKDKQFFENFDKKL